MSATHEHPPYPASIDVHILASASDGGHAYPHGSGGNLPTDILALASLHLDLHLTEGPKQP